MADKFPSIDDLDAGAQTENKDSSAEPSADDFLAREKAVLGEDVKKIVIDDDASIAQPDVDLVAQGAVEGSAFEAQYPDLASQLSTGGFLGASSTIKPISYNSGYQTQIDHEEEPEIIQRWRQERDALITKRAEQFATQRSETIMAAQQNIDDFYENYNTKKEKGIAQARKEAEQFLGNREDVVASGTSWERIAKLIDVSGKGSGGGAAGSGKERFREILTSLRKDEKAPGAPTY